MDKSILATLVLLGIIHILAFTTHTSASLLQYRRKILRMCSLCSFPVHSRTYSAQCLEGLSYGLGLWDGSSKHLGNALSWTLILLITLQGYTGPLHIQTDRVLGLIQLVSYAQVLTFSDFWSFSPSRYTDM